MARLSTPDATRIEGIPARAIRLADGKAWGFARPSLRLAPMFALDGGPPDVAAGPIVPRSFVGYPLAIERLRASVLEACSGGTDDEQRHALLDLAGALLREAHGLGADEAATLLAVPDSDLPRLATEVIEVAFAGPDDDA